MAGRPRNWYWNAAGKRWELRVGASSQPAVIISNSGMSVAVGALSYDALSVGSLLGGNTLLVSGQGTIPNLNIGTLGVIRALAVAGQGSIADLALTTGTLKTLNVGTQTTLRDAIINNVGSFASVNLTTGTMTNINVGTLASFQNVNAGGIGSHANARIAQAKFGGGGTLSFIDCFTGTIALAAVGTNTMGVATMTGVGSAGIAAGDLIFVNPKAALDGLGFGGAFVPTTNVVNVYVVNPAIASAGSLAAVGVDAMVFRITKT